MSTAETSTDDGSHAQEFNKGISDVVLGSRYEERMLALVFLRCLRRGLLFQLSANNRDAGLFDDLVLVWRRALQSDAHTLLVHIRCITSGRPIHRSMLLSQAHHRAFGLGKYCASYEEISKTLDMNRATCVLLTNVRLGDSCLDMFECLEVASVPGVELLNCGDLYRLRPDNQQVLEAVRGNTSFLEHFYLLCRRNVDIERDIHEELDQLLGGGELCEPISESLCNSIRQWMNEENVYLTSAWSKWQALVRRFIREHVSGCRAVTTRLRYCNVAEVRDHVESCNPAWVTPPEKGTEALSATKVHQVVADGPHIVVGRHQFLHRRRRVLSCWGPFCRWLVIVDDDRQDISDILPKLVTQTQGERRLIIVSSGENNALFGPVGLFDPWWPSVVDLVDSCRSSDVSDDSWKKCLDVRVKLDGDRRRLKELVAGVDAVKSLKTLLDDEPALLLALALRMNPEPEPLSKELVDPLQVPVHLLSSLGFRDVCITDSVQYESLRRQLGSHSVTSFAEVGSWVLSPSKFQWPLFVLTDNLNTVPENIRRLPIFKFHIIPYRSGESARDVLREFDAASNVTIVEGTPKVGN